LSTRGFRLDLLRRLSSIPSLFPKPPASTVNASLLGINVNYLLTDFVVGKRDSEVASLKDQTILNVYNNFISPKLKKSADRSYAEILKLDQKPAQYILYAPQTASFLDVVDTAKAYFDELQLTNAGKDDASATTEKDVYIFFDLFCSPTSVLNNPSTVSSSEKYFQRFEQLMNFQVKPLIVLSPFTSYSFLSSSFPLLFHLLFCQSQHSHRILGESFYLYLSSQFG
jgi:hypothetical protein